VTLVGNWRVSRSEDWGKLRKGGACETVSWLWVTARSGVGKVALSNAELCLYPTLSEVRSLNEAAGEPMLIACSGKKRC